MTVTYEDLREAVAEALAEEMYHGDYLPWRGNPEWRGLWRRRADAMLSAIRNNGLAIVPREATRPMTAQAQEIMGRRGGYYYVSDAIAAALAAGEIKPEEGK